MVINKIQCDVNDKFEINNGVYNCNIFIHNYISFIGIFFLYFCCIDHVVLRNLNGSQ